MSVLIIIISTIILYFLRRFFINKFINSEKLFYYVLSIIIVFVGLILAAILASFDNDMKDVNKTISIISFLYFLFSTPKLHVDQNGRYFLKSEK